MRTCRRSLLLALAFVLGASALESHAASGQGKLKRLRSRASAAADSGDFKRANTLYAKVRTLSPKEPGLAVKHAVVQAQLGDREGALASLEEAATLGLFYPGGVKYEDAFVALRGSARYEAVLERVLANQVEHRKRVAEARRPIDPARSREFPDFAALEQAQAEARRDFDSKPSAEPWAIRHARFVEEWVGALYRLAAEGRPAAERERALLEIVRLRTDVGWVFDLAGTESQIAPAVAAADALLAEFPESEHRAETRVARAFAQVAARVPEDFDWVEDPAPRPNCVEALDALEELAAGGPADAWSDAALGLKAICLHELQPERTQDIREAASTYFARHPEPPDFDEASQLRLYDFALRGRLKVVLWRLDGLPPFEAETLDGTQVTLADFAGKVTLLDFWSPG